ncbi:MAG: DNA-processing protein DprA [Ktedonobacteraceae bacterium]
MNIDLQEQACWLLLVFESGLSKRVVNDILVIWCKQLGRTLQAFFAASSQEWSATCHLKPAIIQKLEQLKTQQALLAEQLVRAHVYMLTVLDDNYSRLLKLALNRNHIPPLLFYSGDLQILQRQTMAIIGSRNAGEESLVFTHEVAQYLAQQDANVISGYAHGVDRAAFEGATSTDGYTTVVLPHGIRKLSAVQMRALLPKIEAGNVLLLSQFHPDAPWLVSRAMERNNVVTGLAQVVIVAQSDTKGGTWEGANGALKRERHVYVRQAASEPATGNEALIERGGVPLPWPTENIADILSPLLEVSSALQEKQSEKPAPSEQLSLFAPTKD